MGGKKTQKRNNSVVLLLTSNLPSSQEYIPLICMCVNNDFVHMLCIILNQVNILKF